MSQGHHRFLWKRNDLALKFLISEISKDFRLRFYQRMIFVSLEYRNHYYLRLLSPQLV